MSEATIRANLYSTISGVSNIGKVYDYLRFASTWDAFLTLFKTTISGSSVIRGWTITSEAESRVGFVSGGQRNTYNSKTHTFRIRGYAGLDDSAATEKTFRALVETVMDTLDASAITDVSGVINAGVSQLEVFGNVPFGSVLCHYCEITQQVTENA